MGSCWQWHMALISYRLRSAVSSAVIVAGADVGPQSEVSSSARLVDSSAVRIQGACIDVFRDRWCIHSFTKSSSSVRHRNTHLLPATGPGPTELLFTVGWLAYLRREWRSVNSPVRYSNQRSTAVHARTRLSVLYTKFRPLAIHSFDSWSSRRKTRSRTPRQDREFGKQWYIGLAFGNKVKDRVRVYSSCSRTAVKRYSDRSKFDWCQKIWHFDCPTDWPTAGWSPKAIIVSIGSWCSKSKIKLFIISTEEREK